MDAPVPLAPRGARLALFGEVVLTGAVLAVLSVPVVTAVPALAAGTLHLGRHVDGRADGVADLIRGTGRALRELWAPGLAVPVVLAVLGLDLWLVRTGALPGGAVVGVVTVLVLALVVVVTLRFVGSWRPGSAVVAGVRAAARRAVADPSGSTLLVAAVTMVVVLIWMLQPLVLIAPGLLALAALAVERRTA